MCDRDVANFLRTDVDLAKAWRETDRAPYPNLRQKCLKSMAAKIAERLNPPSF